MSMVCVLLCMAKLIDITGKAISGEWGEDDETGNGIPVIRTTNFTNDGIINYNNVMTRTITKCALDYKFLRKGDIIIEKSGGSDKQPVGRVVYFDGDENKYLFNNFTGLLRVKDQTTCFPRYLFYVLFFNYKKGGTIPFQNKTTGLHNLKTDDYVKKLEIPIVSIEQQIQISVILDKLHSIITHRKQQLEKLDMLVKARFVEMFGDTEHNSKNFPIYKLCNLCTVSSSKRIYQNEQSSSGIPFLRISNLVDLIEHSHFETELFIPEDKYLELLENGLVPQKGDILVTSRGTLGKCYIIQGDDKFYFQDGMISWLYNFDKSITPLYLTLLFGTRNIERQISNLQSGSTVAYLSITMLKKLEVVVPPLSLQNQFAAFVEQTDKTKAAVQKALDEAQVLFDSLMQEYFG